MVSVLSGVSVLYGRASRFWVAMALAMAGAVASGEELAEKHVVVTPVRAQIHDEQGEPVDTVGGGTVLDAFETEGDKVRVNRGWLLAAEVIPYEQAVAYFSDQIAQRPTADAYSARARVWCYHGEFDKALDDCNEALKLDPKSASAHSRRGRAWAGKGELDKAIEDFSQALRLDPADAHALTHRARAYAERGEFELAVNDCNEALRLDPKSNVAYYYRGRARSMEGDAEGAIADFNESLELNPLYVPAWNARANEWYLQQKYRQAAADYDEAIRLNPKFDMVHIHYNRGNARFRLGELKLAAADYQESLEHDPRYSPALEALAQCYAQLGDFAAAAQWQAKAVALSESSKQPGAQARLKSYQASQTAQKSRVRSK